MKFLTFRHGAAQKLGLMMPEGRILRLTNAWGDAPAPTDVAGLIALGEAGLQRVRTLQAAPDPALTSAPEEVEILAPIPHPARNVFCIGRNYRAHIIEGNRARGRAPDDFPKVIEVFTKPGRAVIGPGAAIPRHAGVTAQLDYEVELAVVIGRTAADIPREQAMEAVFGYTILNDVTARDLQAAHGQWFKGKALDGSCPMGPFVVHKSAVADPHALAIGLEVSGEVRQQANTADLLFDIPEIIAQLSRGMTLEAGDIIATGTPSGVGLGFNPPRFLAAGDVVTARIEGLGELVNPVV